MGFRTIEEKAGKIIYKKIELVSDKTERRFNVRGIDYEGNVFYLFPKMVREKKAREVYNIAK